LAQGEYVSPERLENLYAVHPAIATIFIHGDSEQTAVIAIAGADPEPFAAWATKTLRRPIPVSEIESIYKDATIKKTLLKDLERIAHKQKLQGFERIKGIHIATEPFTVENDLLTPTLKLKRADAAKAFRKEINLLYQEVNAKSVKAKL
jgi:long-chain acyl-CoA synthetase